MKILVLDLSPLARRLIREELLVSDYEVIEAESPEQALDILSRVRDISLMTTAVSLGNIDGLEFIANLRSPEARTRLERLNNADIPVLLVTSNDTDADRVKGFRVGAADFIQKPWHRGELAARVESALGQGDELRGMSILVAEDSATTRVFIRACLARLGVTIHEVDDGQAALDFLSRNHVDLVLTDLSMIHLDGDALCLKIRRTLGLTDLPVIFLSATDDRDTIISLFRLGATDYLKKPFYQEELVARLKVHLQREKLMGTLKEIADVGIGSGAG
jgi:DNA-binding response OmpR family regulator